MIPFAIQLIAHGVGDFMLQNQWMADNKAKSNWVCAIHVLLYGLAFYLFTWGAISLAQMAAVVGTHFLIDRLRLAYRWRLMMNIDYPLEQGPINTFVIIAIDQVMHVATNYAIFITLND